MLVIDGSHGEGGGQIIRTAVSLSAVTGKSVKITGIRSSRRPAGLKAQHLAGVKAVAEICDARLKGADIGSTELEFAPGKISGGSFEWDVGTAGSVTLVLQAVLPVMVHAKAGFSANITGGTNVPWSPPAEYFQHIFCDFLSRMGIGLTFEVKRYGFYPKGGGRVSLCISPSDVSPVEIVDRGAFLKTDVWSVASADLEKAKVAERQAGGFRKSFGKTVYGNVNILYVDSLSTGSCIHAHNRYENCRIGAEALGKRGEPAEKVGEEAAAELLSNIKAGAAADRHAEDMLVPYLAMAAAEGVSRIKVPEFTNHTQTNIWVVEKFLPVKFTYDADADVLSCAKR